MAKHEASPRPLADVIADVVKAEGRKGVDEAPFYARTAGKAVFTALQEVCGLNEAEIYVLADALLDHASQAMEQKRGQTRAEARYQFDRSLFEDELALQRRKKEAPKKGPKGRS